MLWEQTCSQAIFIQAFNVILAISCCRFETMISLIGSNRQLWTYIWINNVKSCQDKAMISNPLENSLFYRVNTKKTSNNTVLTREKTNILQDLPLFTFKVKFNHLFMHVTIWLEFLSLGKVLKNHFGDKKYLNRFSRSWHMGQNPFLNWTKNNEKSTFSHKFQVKIPTKMIAFGTIFFGVFDENL